MNKTFLTFLAFLVKFFFFLPGRAGRHRKERHLKPGALFLKTSWPFLAFLVKFFFFYQEEQEDTGRREYA